MLCHALTLAGSFGDVLDWLQSLNVSYYTLVASLTVMALF